MTRYRKPPLSIKEQLDPLQQRGLAIGDIANANRYLQPVGYYRLMGYLYTQRVAASNACSRTTLRMQAASSAIWKSVI